MAQKTTTHPAGTLKKLVDAGKKETRVLGSVERWLLAKPKDTSRPSDVIHPSAMVKADWCHRAEYFTLQGAEPAPPKYRQGMKTLLTFEEGHRIHDRWQTWFWGMNKLYGVFRCNYCKHDFWAQSPDSCPECGYTSLKYREVPVRSAEHGISGHADGWLKGFKDDMLLEVKSVGEGTIRWEDPGFWMANGTDFKKAWANLKAPFQTHIMQSQVYLKLLELTDPEDHPKEAIFIYESKVDQEVKEFVIPKSDFGITHLFDSAAMIMEAIKNQTPPACNIDPAGCWKCEVY